jgi:hypothetical protein
MATVKMKPIIEKPSLLPTVPKVKVQAWLLKQIIYHLEERLPKKRSLAVQNLIRII